jgi:hypothetical protein
LSNPKRIKYLKVRRFEVKDSKASTNKIEHKKKRRKCRKVNNERKCETLENILCLGERREA